MLTKLPYYCAAKRHHNDNSTHVKVSCAVFTLDAKTNKSQIKSFIILAVLRRSVRRFYGAHLRVIAPGQHRSFWRNVAAVASRWQHCAQFDRPEIWTSDLPLQRRTRYRSTKWITNKLLWNGWRCCVEHQCFAQHWLKITDLGNQTSNINNHFLIIQKRLDLAKLKFGNKIGADKRFMPTVRGSVRYNLSMSLNTLSITFVMAVLIYLDWAIFFLFWLFLFCYLHLHFSWNISPIFTSLSILSFISS